jgi:hypothetical protein
MAVTVLVVTGATVIASSTTSSTVPLLVFAGQSNMVGYGSSYYDLAAAQQATQPNVDFYYNDQVNPAYWSALTPPTQTNGVAYWGSGPTPAIGFGPEISVGQDLVNAGLYSHVAEVKAAYNGTFLATQAEIPTAADVNNDWNPSTAEQSGVYGSDYWAMLGDVAAAQQSYGHPSY